jgi:hypothetical protein
MLNHGNDENDGKFFILFIINYVKPKFIKVIQKIFLKNRIFLEN